MEDKHEPCILSKHCPKGKMLDNKSGIIVTGTPATKTKILVYQRGDISVSVEHPLIMPYKEQLKIALQNLEFWKQKKETEHCNIIERDMILGYQEQIAALKRLS